MDGLDTADLTLVVGCEFLAFSDLFASRSLSHWPSDP